jgi:signal transduction histidine kinase
MIKRTRLRLTLQFTGMMITFLISFNAIGYYLLSSTVFSGREQEIQVLADQEMKEHSPDLEHDRDKLNPWGEEEENAEDEGYEHSREMREPVATSLLPFYLILDSEGQRIAGDWPHALDQDALVRQLDHWLPKSGEVKYLDYRDDQNNKYLGSIVTGADITQQTEILHHLIRILIALSVLFLAVSAVLGHVMSGRAMVPISRSFERQRQFVADASHELRTPISIIHASLEVIEAEEGDRMQPFSRQVLDDMKDEVQRMSSLAGHLLALARADTGKLQLRMESFDVREELETLMRKTQPLAAAKNLQLSLEADAGLRIQADRERFRQLAVILVDNAIQYTPDHGQIRIAAGRQDARLVLSVSDTGIGIPKEKLEDIFERFYRADASRSHTKGNAGLGLSIAKWIAESHGGTITAESEPGQGSTFTLVIPGLV